MIRVVLVRHAETIWHAENRYAGSSDIELSERGHQQASALARWARSADIARLYVSPMARTIATVRPIAEALSLPPIVDLRLRELDFGSGEGLTAAEMTARMPERYREYLRNPVQHHLPDGEDPRDAIVRARAVIRDIIENAAELPASSSRRILIVTHNTLIRLLLCDTLGLDPSLYRRVFPQVGSVSVTELGFTFEKESSSPIISLLHFNAPLAGAI